MSYLYYLSSLSYLSYLSVHLSICLSVCLSAGLKAQLFYDTSSVCDLDNVKAEKLLRDPQFLNLTTSKTNNYSARRFNVQKWRAHVVLCTFWFRNVLCATTARTFSTSQFLKVLCTRLFFTLLTSKCASRHNGVQFFISHLASWLRTRRFSEPTFRPSGTTNHWKNTVFLDFCTLLSYLFAHLDLLSSETFSFWSSFFFSSLLWLFPSLLFIWPYCRKFGFLTSFDNYLTGLSDGRLSTDTQINIGKCSAHSLQRRTPNA